MTLHAELLATWIRARVRSERGASLVEYALLVTLIAMVCVAAVSQLGGKISNNFDSVAGKL